MALVAALALALPAASSASNGYVTHAGFYVTGVARGTDGFDLQFWEGNKHGFKLTVKGHHSKTRYVTKGGSVAGGRVSARLGKRGILDLRFVPVGKPRFYRPPSWCKGSPSRWQPGYLVGRLVFHGERDYTHVGGRRFWGGRESWSSWRCHYATGPDRYADKEARARVGSWSLQRKAVTFGAALFHRDARPRDRRVEFSASISDRAGRVRVQHEVEVAAAESDVAFPDGPLSETATVTPPAPFIGTATFTRTHESTFTWTGDLSVAFPGLDPVRLAGPRFGARLCTAEGCISRDQERYFGER
ncbi:MAG: hypothetical protein JST59_12565 [Actinobacteria bacterium]|nr:hypothetical protein [Actinomycetota bacterium]